MLKNLIIGAFSNYNYDQLKPWVESIDQCGFVGDKVMVVGESSQETKDQLIKRNFKLVEMPKVNAPVHVSRFLGIYDYLKDFWQEYNFVVTTDVRDVYFQKDPTKDMQNILGDKYKLFAGSESILYRDEPWGNDNLMRTYGHYVYNLFKDNIIYNVGTIGGMSEYVKDLAFDIFINSINRPIPIVDQAVYNVLIQTQPFKDVVYKNDQSTGWAVQLGTTGNPAVIDVFRPFLTEKEPIFDYESGLVKTADGVVFSIVHQYDRVPEWEKVVAQKFQKCF
jgi:hypothetical protein